MIGSPDAALLGLERLIPSPRYREVDHLDVLAPPARAYEVVRHWDLARSPLVKAVFTLRALPDRLRGAAAPPVLRLDDLGATGPGMRLLVDAPEGDPRRFVVGTVSRFGERGADAGADGVTAEGFAAFDEAGWGKLAWEVRFEPRDDGGTRVRFELRADATDDAAWDRLRTTLRLVGPVVRFVRQHVASMIRAELFSPDAVENEQPLAGDELIPSPKAQVTHAITIDAPPAAVWPWLVQMGAGRGGWYAHDVEGLGAHAGARSIDPGLQHLEVGDVLSVTAGSEDGFVVRSIEPARSLVLGGAYDLETRRALAADEPLPASYWRVTWAFVLRAEPRDDAEPRTRLLVRARVDFAPDSVRWQARLSSLAHGLMERTQLKNIKALAEGRAARHVDLPRDVGEGILGALGMLVGFGTPFRRAERSHWGLTEDDAARTYPGDDRVPAPRWSYTHAVEIEALPSEVWPWVAQIGQDKAGFYSYQWLENLAGCDVQNADRVHAEWQDLRVGDELRLHPRAPPIPVVAVKPGEWFLAHAAAGEGKGEKWASVSWLFFLEPLEPGRTRFISRYRVDYGDDVAMELVYGPHVVEPVAFAMDKRMLLGVKERAERSIT